jgi:hypothetical protein
LRDVKSTFFWRIHFFKKKLFGALTRGVNGVVKAHSAGETVQLADPAYYSL